MTIFILKAIALLTMFIDHVGEFFPFTFPIWLRWIGRISAPIFIFCLTEGMRHTSSRENYIKRLYFGSAFMGIGSFALNFMFPEAPVFLTNNIFSTLFLICIIIAIWENQKNIAAKNKKNIFLYFIGFQMLSIVGCNYLLAHFGRNYAALCSAILPNILYTEGSVATIILGILMYVMGKNAKIPSQKKGFIIAYILYCGMLFSSAVAMAASMGNYTMLLEGNFQWMMIASLPFMMCYNGEKGGERAGKKGKWIFYLFYPIHIFILFIISNL